MSKVDGFDNNPKPGVLFHQSSKSVLDGPRTRSAEGRKASKYKLQKGESKKTLVRNTELAVHPTTYKTDAPAVKKKDREPAPQAASGNVLYKTNLSAPSLNSALRIVKEMKEASRVQPLKAQCAKLLDEGKVLQQVNFLYEEHLYHDLVALNVSDTVVSEAGSSRNTSKFRVRDKDKEPQLSQFFTPSFSEEHHIPRDPPHRSFYHLDSSDSFSIYQRMKSWDVAD